MFGMRLEDSSLAFISWEMAGQNWSPRSLEGEGWLPDEVLFKQQVSPFLIKAPVFLQQGLVTCLLLQVVELLASLVGDPLALRGSGGCEPPSFPIQWLCFWRAAFSILFGFFPFFCSWHFSHVSDKPCLKPGCGGQSSLGWDEGSRAACVGRCHPVNTSFGGNKVYFCFKKMHSQQFWRA